MKGNRVGVCKILLAFIAVAVLAVTAINSALALSASNIDLIYYNSATHKPVYEVQFLTVPLAYDTGSNPKLIVYGAGTSFKIQVTNYESNVGGVIVKLVNVYDGTEKILGSLNRYVPTKEFTVSNLYPGYWKVVIVGTDNLPTWDLSNASAPTNGGPHEIEIVGTPELVVGLLNPSRNIALGDTAKILVKVEGLYGETNVSVEVIGKHTLNFYRTLGRSNSTWILNVPTDKLGTGECRVLVRTMGIIGSLTFNVVGVNVTNVSVQSASATNASNASMVCRQKMHVNATNASSVPVNVSVKNRIKRLNETVKMKNKNVSTNNTVNSTVNAGAGRTNATGNKTGNKTAKTRTPGFEAVIAVAALLALAVTRRIR